MSTVRTSLRQQVMRVIPFALALGIWFWPDTRRADERGLASLCYIRGGYRRCHLEFISSLDGLTSGGIGCSADSYDRPC